MTAPDGAADLAVSAQSEPPASPGSPEPPERPEARRHRLVARAVLAAITVLLGVAQAAVWANIAPGQQIKVFADGSYVSLPTADYHPFDGLMLFVLASAAVGLVVAVAAWRIRAIRGTTTLLTVFAATSTGSAIAFGLGLLLARGVDPATIGKTGHDSIVVAGPSLSTPLAIIAEPLLAVVVYTFLAAWDGRPDLGRKRATIEPAVPDVGQDMPKDPAQGTPNRPAQGAADQR